MQTIQSAHSFGRRFDDGHSVVFDFITGERTCGWYRHCFDALGSYVSAGPCSLDDVCADIASAGPRGLVAELARAAEALDGAQADLLAYAEELEGFDDARSMRLAQRAMHVRRARCTALVRIVAVGVQSPVPAGGTGPGFDAEVEFAARALERDFPVR